jgi:hypothetical protein
VREASNINLLAQGWPAIASHQVSQELFKGNSMQWIVWLGRVHGEGVPATVIAFSDLFIVIAFDPLYRGVVYQTDDAF